MPDLDNDKVAAKQKKAAEKELARAIREVDHYNDDVDKLHDAWDSKVANVERQLEFFKTYEGEESSEHILLHKGERFIAMFAAGLIEERAGQAHYVGGNQGFSIPIGSIGGRSIRYHVGSTRGHMERGAPVEATIDEGRFIITNQRIVFVGSKQTRECAFAKLVSIEQPYSNRTVISVSNRQKATILSYDSESSDLIHLSVLLATAMFQETKGDLIASWEQALTDLREQEPKLAPMPTLEQIQAKTFVPPDKDGNEDWFSAPKETSRLGRQGLVLAIISLGVAFIPLLGMLFWLAPFIVALVIAFKDKENRKRAALIAWIAIAAAVISIFFTINVALNSR